MLKKEYDSNFKNILVHSIRADKAMVDLSVASKFDTSWNFLTMLRDKGRAVTQAWLDKNFQSIGKKDTVDLHSEFLCTVNKIFEENHNSSNNHPYHENEK